MNNATIILIGCSKTKIQLGTREWIEAKYLYAGELFKLKRAYAEERKAEGIPWFILSAKLGLIPPETRTRNYDATLSEFSEHGKNAWALEVTRDVCDFFTSNHEFPSKPNKITVEIHAGRTYHEPIERILKMLGFHVQVPTRGLGIGKQKAFYINRQFTDKHWFKDERTESQK